MHNVSIEAIRKHVPVDATAGVFVYRPLTEFSQFVMAVVKNIREMDLQRIVILAQKGVSEVVIDDAMQRIAELLESEKPNKNKKIALECFHGLTRAELRRLKRQWQRSRQNHTGQP